jgi:hypothetical protein
MTEPPPRKRFQIHLSTAMLLMLAVGGLMLANMRGRLETPIEQIIKDRIEKRGSFYANADEFMHVSDAFSTGYKNCNYGWPFDAITTYDFISVGKNGDITKHPGALRIYHSESAMLDALIVILILASMAIVGEWWIGNAARKGA